MPACLVLVRIIFWLADSSLLTVCSHGGERAISSVSSFFVKMPVLADQNSILMTALRLGYLLKVLSSTQTHASTYKFRGDTFNL